MSKIDRRIVDMQFNNREFENGIQRSIGSLDRLKKSLKLDGAANSLSRLGATANRFSLAGIASGIDQISGRFTTMGIVGVTALQNITNKAVSAGQNMIHSLTLRPITTGLAEYETKMNAITTILTNTAHQGTKLEDVTRVLNDLNEYADQTIYNFAQMTRNIGTFTAAGIDLDTAATAIRGIANLAAGSGSSAEQAATAMYQLSQAIAGGAVRLQDWNSVVNAGMGGMLFQRALKKTAREMGIVVDEAVPFRASLEQGWLTSRVLVKTLSDFAKDKTLLAAATNVRTFTQLVTVMQESVQSSWAQTFEHIIGNRDEAIALLTRVNDAFGRFAGPIGDARNELFLFWKLNEGRAFFIESLANVFTNLNNALAPFTKAYHEIFPRITGEQLVQLTMRFYRLTQQFKMGEETAQNLQRTFRGVFSVIKLMIQGLKFSAGVIIEIVKLLAPVGREILNISAQFGDFLYNVSQMVKTRNLFHIATERIRSTFSNIGHIVRDTIQRIKKSIDEFNNIDLSPLINFSKNVEINFRPFLLLGQIASTGINLILSVFNWALPLFVRLGSIVGEVIASFATSISNTIKRLDADRIIELINAGLFGALLYGIRSFMTSLKNMTDGAGGVFSGIVNILDGVRGSLEAYQKNLKAGALMKIAIAIGILAISLLVLASIPSDKLAAALASITLLFVELSALMIVLAKTTTGGVLKLAVMAGSMIAIAASIFILAGALRILARLDWEQLLRGVIAVGTLSTILVTAADALSKNSGRLIRGSLGLIFFASALVILTKAVKNLSEIELVPLARGLIGVGVLVGILSKFLLTKKLGKFGITTAGAILILAAAINVFARAVKALGDLDVKVLYKGLATIGVIFAQLVLFSKLMITSKKIVGISIGMVILAGALNILYYALKNIGSLNFTVISNGLIGIGGSLLLIALGMKLMPKNLIPLAIGLTIISTSLLLLSKAFSNIGKLSTEQLTRALIGMAGAFLIIGIAMKALTFGLASAGALLILSAAVVTLAVGLRILGGLELKEIGSGLLALAGALGVLALAAVLLKPLAPILLLISGSILIFGLGILALGTGIFLFSAALTALSVAGTAASAAIVLISSSLVSLIPLTIRKIGEGIISFLQVLKDGLPLIVDAISALFKGLIRIFVEIIPPFVESIFVFLGEFFKTIYAHLPQIIQSGIDLFLGFLKGLSINMQELTVVALKIVEEFLKGVAVGLPGVVDSATQVVLTFIRSLIDQLPAIIDAGFKLIISFINGLADAIRENTEPLIKAFGNLATAMIEGLVQGLFGGVRVIFDAIRTLGRELIRGFKELLGIKSPSTVFRSFGVDIINGLINGLNENLTNIRSAIGRVANDILTRIRELPSQIRELATEVGNGFASGLRAGGDIVGRAAKTLGQTAINAISSLLGIKSPSLIFANIGEMTGLGFVRGLEQLGPSVNRTASDMGQKAVNSMQKSISKLMDLDLDFSPVITPIIDLTNVRNGLSDVFKQDQQLRIGDIKNLANSSLVARRDNVNYAIPEIKTATPTNQTLNVTNHFVVRSDDDVRRISYNLNNMLDRFNHAKGVLVP